MKKIIKKSLVFVGIGLVVLVLAVVLLYIFFGEKSIETAIETGATKAMKVGVELDGVSLKLFKGKAGIYDLVVQNPSGYEHENLMTLDRADIWMDIGSVFKDTVVIKEFTLDGMNLVIEQKGTTNNLKDVINNLPKSEKEAKERKKEAGEKAGKKLKIEKLTIKNVKVRADLLPVPGKATTVTLALDPIVLEDIGGDNGINSVMLTQKILVAIAGGVTKQGASLLPEDITGSMKDALETTLGVGEDLLKQGGKILEPGKDLGKELEETGKDVMEGVKGIFGGKKTKEKEE